MKTIKLIVPIMMLLAACSKDNSDVTPASPTGDGSASTTETASKAAVTRVFKANLYTSLDTNSAIPPTFCTGDLPGFANPGIFMHGHATHMGNLISQLSRVQDDACNLSFATGQLTTVASGQLTGSNGDLIYVSAIDTIDASNYLNSVSYDGTITGTWTINGGTGKFAGASGSFRISGPVDFATTSFSCTCTGTITY